MGSCKSIDKMVESGNYDEAFRFGIDKLRGKKDKKTKYVRAIEKAYNKMNAQDLKDIRYYSAEGRINSFDRVVDLYNKIEARQRYIEPLLPLYSKDGYYADIVTNSYTEEILEAKKLSSELHYEAGIKKLDIAKSSGNKKYAKEAYNHFKDSEYYFDTFEDSYALKTEAYRLGQTNVLLEIHSNGSNIAFEQTQNIITEIASSDLSTKWIKYHTNLNGPSDLIATIEISDIYPGKEVERYNSFVKEKDIIDGQRPAKSINGETLKDTSGNVVYVDKIKTVSAQVEELIREKVSSMNGRVVIVDAVTNSLISTIPIEVTHLFEDYSLIMTGDKRALDNNVVNRVKDYCAPFPSDYEMTTSLAIAYKESAIAALRQIRS